MPSPRRRARRLDAVMQRFPMLGRKRRQAARTLSGGERQMLAMGMALMVRAGRAAARRALGRAVAGGGAGAVRRYQGDQPRWGGDRAGGAECQRGAGDRRSRPICWSTGATAGRATPPRWPPIRRSGGFFSAADRRRTGSSSDDERLRHSTRRAVLPRALRWPPGWRRRPSCGRRARRWQLGRADAADRRRRVRRAAHAAGDPGGGAARSTPPAACWAERSSWWSRTPRPIRKPRCARRAS